ncbi:Uncharacterized protein OBRU01_14662 [Operophtera brumata]|uniref:Uncharacterized protein n=1 Tax=Operophtera brumata TaxID=104452 RepID=A0A0L7KUX4_OPEBR|nr:Uncharacterized protein OBRU01_14662 [Operophtera brumata]
MYHFPNQQLYHHNNHNPYQQQCPINIEDTKLQTLNTISEAQYRQVIPQNLESNALLHIENTIELPPLQPEVTESVKKKKTAPKKTRSQVEHGDVSKKAVKKPSVDTSNFSIEERLVAAVWVHERKYTSNTINKQLPKRRVKPPPRKNLPSAPPPPPAAPPAPHTHYVMHAVHSHGYT